MISVAKQTALDSLLERSDCLTLKIFRNPDGSTACSFEISGGSMKLDGSDPTPDEASESLQFVQQLAGEFQRAGVRVG